MRIPFLKSLLYVTSIMFAGLLLNESVLHADSIEYEDYSEQHTYPNKILEEQITVYSKDGQYDVEDVQKSINLLEKLPPHIFDILEIKDIQIIFVEFPIPDLKGLEFLDEEEGVRGYSEGSTYRDDVFGFYIEEESIKRAIVRTDEDIRESRSPFLTLHEIGHAMSYGDLFTDYFSTDEFINAHRDEKPVLFPDDDYFDIKSEYFAEIFAYYFMSDELRKELREKAPKSFGYIERFIKYPFYISENTIDEVVLTWTEVEDAVSYDVVRDGVVIDNVTDTTYKDNNYNNYILTYEVIPVDQNGNQVFEFNKEMIQTKLLDRQNIELNEKLEQEAKEWEEKITNTITLEDVLEKFNIPANYLPIIFWTILLFVVLILPVTIVGITYFLVRRKRRILKQSDISS